MGSLIKSRLFLTVVLVEKGCLFGKIMVRDSKVSKRTERNLLKMRIYIS